MQFELALLPQIFFGSGQIQNIQMHIRPFGSRVLLVADQQALKTAQLEENLIKNSFEYCSLIVKSEPTTDVVDQGVSVGLEFKAEIVIGIGGGSALDAGKAIAGILTNGGVASDYMEVVGRGIPIKKPALPYIAIPTTAGTGSEVTKNAVILSEKEKYKASIRSPFLVSKIAIIDPSLTLSVPANVTASTGLDALTQLIEAYTSNKSQPITDALAVLGIQKAVNSLEIVYKHGDNLAAREDMALASLLSGICLANAGLGAVHGFASPLGASIPHGVACAALLAAVVDQNIQSLKAKAPNSPALVKYMRLGELITSKTYRYPAESHRALVQALRNLTKNLKIPALSKFGLKETDIPDLITKVKKSSSIRYNPVELDETALTKILTEVLQTDKASR
jgi:alcohol dehydrogenase class IV